MKIPTLSFLFSFSLLSVQLAHAGSFLTNVPGLGYSPQKRAAAPLLHLDAVHKAFATRKGDPTWRDPKRRIVI